MRYVSKSCCDSKVAAYLLLSTLPSCFPPAECMACLHKRSCIQTKHLQQQVANSSSALTNHCRRPLRHFCMANQTPCQNDAHRNGTCETQLSSPEELANPRKRRGQANMLRAGDHVIMTVWCVLNGTHSGKCCGRVGVQRGICCVVEARVVQIVCMLFVAGRPHQRRELWIMWCRAAGPTRGSRVQVLYVCEGVPLMFLRDRSGGGARRRLPLRTARYPSWVPLFTPYPSYSHLHSTFSYRSLSYLEHQSRLNL